ncbi:MAG: GTP cyclohydrolase II, partial [Rhodobacteraceae bacterium]|nr:GTP cyclohydrolase II [Paracoccaceae bacterium]
MSLVPDITEFLARARADLRMGLPVVLNDRTDSVLALAIETLTSDRLTDLRAISGQPVIAITSRRAETLKARAYDGDLARVLLPANVDLKWVLSIADPADDLRVPMKGPLTAERGGS